MKQEKHTKEEGKHAIKNNTRQSYDQMNAYLAKT